MQAESDQPSRKGRIAAFVAVFIGFAALSLGHGYNTWLVQSSPSIAEGLYQVCITGDCALVPVFQSCVYNLYGVDATLNDCNLREASRVCGWVAELAAILTIIFCLLCHVKGGPGCGTGFGLMFSGLAGGAASVIWARWIREDSGYLTLGWAWWVHTCGAGVLLIMSIVYMSGRFKVDESADRVRAGSAPVVVGGDAISLA